MQLSKSQNFKLQNQQINHQLKQPKHSNTQKVKTSTSQELKTKSGG